ncbi:MAG: T9SS type A sorting domain-containing protein [Bacteroidota bacterium]
MLLSIQLGAQALLGPQSFDTDIIIHGTSAPTTVWFAPDYYSPLDYHATGGCPDGFAGYQGTWNNYWMNFLRTPAVNCTGLDSVKLIVDISNSYFVSHTNDYVKFNMWIDGGYHDAVINTNVYFTQVRDCETIEVVYDLTPYSDKTAVLFYLNAYCGYNDSQNFYVKFDNVGIYAMGGPSSCDPFAGYDTSTCSPFWNLSWAYLSSGSSVCTWSVLGAPAGASASFNDPASVNTIVYFDSTGVYSFLLTESNGSCTGYDTIIVNFLETPVIYAGNDTLVCGFEFDLEAVTGGYPGGWNPETGITFADPSDPNTHVTSDHYGSVVLGYYESNYFCYTIDFVTITFDPCSKVDPVQENRVLVYPNPSVGEFFVTTDGKNDCEISIFDATGRKIFNNNLPPGKHAFSFDKGLYLIIVKNQDESYVFQHIMQ